METEKYQPTTANELVRLELQVDKLIKVCSELEDENSLLRTHQTSLVSERANLIEKTELARTRVEAMITRLKAMENEA